MRYRTNDAERGHPDNIGQSIAQGMGVFSVLLGLTELVLGGPIAQTLGLTGYEWIIYVYGVREIFAGILIFAFKDSLPWMWFRVFGDLIDLATVAFGYSRHLADNSNFVIAIIALTGATAIDVYCAIRLSGDSKEPLSPKDDYIGRSGLPIR